MPEAGGGGGGGVDEPLLVASPQKVTFRLTYARCRQRMRHLARPKCSPYIVDLALLLRPVVGRGVESVVAVGAVA